MYLFVKIVKLKEKQMFFKFLKEKLNVENVEKEHLDLLKRNKLFCKCINTIVGKIIKKIYNCCLYNILR